MNTQTFTFDTKTNVGTADRYVRFAIGSGLIAVPLLFSGVDAELAVLTSLVAIPVIFTAIARWCPVYALLHVHSIIRQQRGEYNQEYLQGNQLIIQKPVRHFFHFGQPFLLFIR